MARIEFKLPDIGEGVAEGEITSWKVKAGDTVTEDQVMVEVMTDKATVEIGSPVTGSIVEITAAEGDTVPVGSVIVVLSDEAGAPAAAPAPETAPAAASPAPEPAVAAAPAATPAPAAAGDDGGEEINFALPDIGEGVAEGEVTKWMVAAGDAVIEDQPIVEVMTDKATVEIGSPVDGKVVELLVKEGDTVPVGEILLVLSTAKGAGASVPAPAHQPAAAAPAAQPVAVGAATATASDTGLPSRPDGTRRVRAAPATRRLAREMGVDISLLAGSGPHGRVTHEDVRRAGSAPAAPAAAPAAAAVAEPPQAAPAPAPAPAAPAAPKAPAPAPKAPAPKAPAPAPVVAAGDERVPLRGLRKRIAAQMRVAKDTAAHFTYVEEIDATELVKLRKAAKRKGESMGVKVTFMPFIIKALVPALREFPLLTSSLDLEAGEIVFHKDLNLGIAVETEAGLIVPVLRQADTKTLVQLAAEMKELADRARAGKTRPDDVGGGTFTITNAGNIGGLLATPIINVPEVAILGVHAIRQRPWVVDGEIVIRDIMLLSLSLDHRVVDGSVGAHFMNRVKELLENPALLLLEEM